MSEKERRQLFDHPAQFLKLGLDLIRSGQGRQADALARQAVVARPDDPLIAALAGRLGYARLPSYHYAMLRDTVRNAAYRQAIELFAPGRTVLDIGTGSGLQAMIAARAGAAHVHACEFQPVLAATAREIVAANGLTDRITIHACHSGRLDRVRDLGGGVDLIVSEILAHDVLGERVLPSLAHARAQLAAPGAVFLPLRASVRVALADEPALHVPLGEVEGFDLSLFNRHVKKAAVSRDYQPGFALRSVPADLLNFDFSADLAMEGRASVSLASTGGRVTGIAQWMFVELGGGATYENPPGTNPEGHWRAGYFPISAPRETDPGEAVTIGGWHNHESIAVWAER